MANVPNGVETLPKISTGWVGRTNVSDDRQTDRWQTYGRQRQKFIKIHECLSNSANRQTNEPRQKHNSLAELLCARRKFQSVHVNLALIMTCRKWWPTTTWCGTWTPAKLWETPARYAPTKRERWRRTGWWSFRAISPVNSHPPWFVCRLSICRPLCFKYCVIWYIVSVAARGCLPPWANVFVAASIIAVKSPIDILMVTTMALVWTVNSTLSWGCNYIMQWNLGWSVKSLSVLATVLQLLQFHLSAAKARYTNELAESVLQCKRQFARSGQISEFHIFVPPNEQ